MTEYSPGQRVTMHKTGYEDAMGRVTHVVFKVTVRLDKPYRPRGGPAIEDDSGLYDKAIPLGTRMHIRGGLVGGRRGEGAVVACEQVYVVELDRRCVDSGMVLKYAAPPENLEPTAEPFRSYHAVAVGCSCGKARVIESYSVDFDAWRLECAACGESRKAIDRWRS